MRISVDILPKTTWSNIWLKEVTWLVQYQYLSKKHYICIWHIEVLTLQAKTFRSRYIVFKQCCSCDEWLQARTFHWSVMQGKSIYLPACRHYKIDIFILILICNSVMSGYFVILCTPLCSLCMWLLLSCKIAAQISGCFSGFSAHSFLHYLDLNSRAACKQRDSKTRFKLYIP